MSRTEEIVGTKSSGLDVLVGWLPLLWATGSICTSIFVIAGLSGTRKLRRQSRIVLDGEAHALAIQLARSLGMTHRFGLGVCDRISTPILLGIIRPLILLPPAAITGWTVDDLEMALLHELAHLRRHDNLVNLWQCVVESFLFFHPTTWWLSGWIRLERERCCDRLVVERTGRPRRYAELLAAIAGVRPIGAAVSALTERPIVARIRTILNMEEKSMKLTLTEGFGMVAAAVLAAIMAIGAYAFAGSPPGTAPTVESKRAMLRTLVRKAAEVSVDSPEFDDRGEALMEIAQSQFQLGDRESAVETLRHAELALKTGGAKAKVPAGMASFLSTARLASVWHAIGDVAAARAALDRATLDLKAIKGSRNQDAALASLELGPEAADSGDPVGAMVAELSSTLIEARIALGDLEEARRLIAWSLDATQGVKGPMRALLFWGYASLSARAGDLQRARELVLQAQRESLSLPPRERTRMRQFAGHVLAECGDLDQAIAAVKEQDAATRAQAANELLEAFREHDPDELSGWLDPAGIKILIGTRGTKRKGSISGIRDLAARIRELDDTKIQARALSDIALLLAKSGELRDAIEVAEMIPAIARRNDPGPSDGFYESVKPGTFAMIAARMAKAGDRAEAETLFDRSATLIRAIESPGERLIGMIVLADARADTGDRPATAAIVREATEIARPLPEPRRSRSLVMLIRTLTRSGNLEAAVPMIDLLRVYPGVEKAQALIGLAQSFERAGNQARARGLASQAITCSKVEKPDGYKQGPKMNVNSYGRDTFIDPDLEFGEQVAQFQCSLIVDQAFGLLDSDEAERVAKAKPVMKRQGIVGGRNMALGSLASSLAAKGKFDEAMRIAGGIEEPHDRLWTYQQMARTIRESGKSSTTPVKNGAGGG